MSNSIEALSRTIKAMRPTLPAKDFHRSLQFYIDLGFQHRLLTDCLAEMTLGTCSFLLQNYYAREWADNFVIHVFVSDLNSWWDHIVALDLTTRYGVRTRSPQLESWGVRVAGLIDPSAVLWRIHEVP
jgi:hypothetical protein